MKNYVLVNFHFNFNQISIFVFYFLNSILLFSRKIINIIMNKALQKRVLLFLIGCMGSRFMIVYLAKVVSPILLKIMGIIALLMSIGFISIYIFSIFKITPTIRLHFNT